MINLKEVIAKYPECLGSASKLRSYLVDLYPTEKRDIFIICAILDCGIVEEIKALAGDIDDITLNRFCEILENNFGTSPKLAKECLLTWGKVFSYSKGLEIVDGVLKGIGTCTDKNIVIPYGVTEIAEWAFCHEKNNGPFDPPDCYGDDFESITIPNSVKKIGDYAFSCCFSLKKLEIPDSVTELGALESEYSFGESALKEIKLGRGLYQISGEIFRYCLSLKKITIYENTNVEECLWDEDFPQIEEIDFIGSIEGWNSSLIPQIMYLSYNFKLFINGIHYDCVNEIFVPETVDGLTFGSLNAFSNLQKITIGSTVSYIERAAFNDNIEEIIFENQEDLWEQETYHPHPDSEPDHDRGTYTTKTISFKGLSPKEIANYIKEQNSRCSWRKIEKQEKYEKSEIKEQLKQNDLSLTQKQEKVDAQATKNVKYKLCPKCETNYIKEDEDFCEECKYYEKEKEHDNELDIDYGYGKPDLGYLEDIENDEKWRPGYEDDYVKAFNKK